VFSVRGLVFIVPLVGWVPLQPPEALQDCAPVALHCKLAEVPLVTLLFFATRVTAGLATSLPAETDALLAVVAVAAEVSAEEES
jgi:hypothetical protein